MFSVRALSLFGVGLLLAASEALAAPLHLVSSRIETKISGDAVSGLGYPANYSATSSSFGGWSSRLADSVVTLPAAPGAASARAGSSAGVQIEQPAPNEFVITLSSTSNGGFLRTVSPGGTPPAGYRADSFATLDAAIAIDPSPGHDLGAPAKVYVTVEHLGDLSSSNDGHVTSDTSVNLWGTADGSFSYQKTLTLPSGNPGDFTDLTVTGHRDATVTGEYTALVGQTLKLSALFNTRVDQRQASLAATHVASAAAFEDGLRIHLTIMPEPGAACLGLLGVGLAVLRRRR